MFWMCQCPDGFKEDCNPVGAQLHIQESRDGHAIKTTIFYPDGSTESKPFENGH